MKTVIYNIAQHIISLSMCSSSVLWNMLDNYLPFWVEQTDKEPILKVIVSESLSLERTSYLPILVNSSKQEDLVAFDLYKNENSEYLIEVKVSRDNSVNALLALSKDFKRADIQLFGNERVQAVALNRAIMVAYLLATAEKETILIHASAVKNNEMGYLFLGKSDTGKSTHAQLWIDFIPGSELINDDNPIVRVIAGKPMVFGSPWSGKTPCYRNVSAPIGGFVRLKQAPANKIRCQSAVESYASLMASGSGMSWEKQLADGKDKIMSELIKLVPFYLLECLPNEAAAQLSSSTIIN